MDAKELGEVIAKRADGTMGKMKKPRRLVDQRKVQSYKGADTARIIRPTVFIQLLTGQQSFRICFRDLIQLVHVDLLSLSTAVRLNVE